MTNFVWDGTILAADSQITCSDEYVAGRESKIFIAHNIAITSGGHDDDCEKFIKWVIADKALPGNSFPKMKKDFLGLLLFPPGIPGTEEYKPGPYEVHPNNKGRGEFIRMPKTFGAYVGRHFMAGAMAAGKNAHQALELACEYCLHSGKPVYSITLEQLAALPPDFVGLWEYTYDYRVGGQATRRKRDRR